MRRIRFTQYERILSEDLNNISNAIYDSVLDRIVGNLVKGSTGCILGDGLVITQSSVTSLGVTAGEVLYKRSSVPIGESAYTLIGTQATATVAVPAAHATLPRIDTLVLVPDDATQESYTRDVRIGGSNTVSSATVDKITEYIGTLLLVVGTPNASPVAPSAPAGTLKIAEVYVTPAVGVVNTAAITPSLQKWELINATNPTLQSLTVAGAISCDTLSATTRIATPDLDATTLGGTLDIGDTNASTVNIGTKPGSQINVGSSTSTIVLDGIVTTINTTNLDVEDKLIRANKGGLAASGGESGLEIEEGGSATAYVKTNTARTGWEIKAPTKGIVDIQGAASAKTTLVATSTADRTINFPNASGTLVGTGDTGSVTSVMIANETIVDGDISPSASISGSKIQAASASNAGVVTTGTQVLAGSKEFSTALTLSGTPGAAATNKINIGAASANQLDIVGDNTFRLSISTAGLTGNRSISAPNLSGEIVVGSGTQSIGGVKTFTSNGSFTSGTTATSTTTGALTVTGGMGVSGTLFANAAMLPGGALEVGFGRGSDGPSYLDLISTGANPDFDARIIRNSGANAALGIYSSGTGEIEIRNTTNATTGQGVRVQGYRNGAPGTGYVGEGASQTLGSNTSFGGPDTPKTFVTLTLDPGIWLVYAQAAFDTSATTRSEVIVSIGTALNTLDTGCMASNSNPGNSRDIYLATRPRLVSITTSTPYYLTCRAGYSGSSPLVLATVSLLAAVRL
jgi:hypothetical protein